MSLNGFDIPLQQPNIWVHGRNLSHICMYIHEDTQTHAHKTPRCVSSPQKNWLDCQCENSSDDDVLRLRPNNEIRALLVLYKTFISFSLHFLGGFCELVCCLQTWKKIYRTSLHLIKSPTKHSHIWCLFDVQCEIAKDSIYRFLMRRRNAPL